jgi:two-component system osmolarity sensor histidine kinase EnvZ
VPRKRVTSTTTWLLLTWMIGGSLVLSAIAVYFLRLQVRPIRQLARAADSFGKGRDVGDFRPRGALEIRQAAHAFNLMRHRILRHISQRTEMLAAVSHDLRTPLTRMRLELELVGPEQDSALSGLRQDVGEMSKLVDEYLGFARGEGRESVEPTELGPILDSMRQRAERSGVTLEISMDRPVVLPLRPTAFHRCLGNLVDNACRYAHWIGISVKQKDEMVEIAVDDDGPGIPEIYREKVFEPFVRLDEQPAGENAGTGLGLTIARDVVLSHGGELRLDQSRRGGLRAVLRMPA